MNKYQEAHDRLKRMLYGLDKYVKNMGMSFVIRDLEILQELVDKETPKKVDIDEEFWICPSCGLGGTGGFKRYKYCPICGQNLDWSEDNG